MEDQEISGNPSGIQGFYSGRDVLLTGVSGFLGKAILEKLLRSCPQIGTVNVIVRPKRGMDPHERLEKNILSSPIFDTLKSQTGSVSSLASKIRIIPGDITQASLGIDEEDRDHLLSTVSVVIHSAASVKFNEPLKTALDINYFGTRRLIDLAKRMKHLVSFVHVSTAYSNCDLKHIPEKILPLPQCDLKIEEIMALGTQELEDLTPTLLGNKPNTYAYAKAMTELFLESESKELDFPVVIVRPSIIGAVWQDPIPGYVDSLCGMTGMVAGTGKGFLTCMGGPASVVADIIPLDITVNTVIAGGYQISKSSTEVSPAPMIINCCSGPTNPITNGEIWKYTREALDVTPFNQAIRYPSLSFTTSPTLCLLYNVMSTLLPLLIIDVISLIARTIKKGRKPVTPLTRKSFILSNAFKRLMSSVLVYFYFNANTWTFEGEGMRRLESLMEPKDREIFYLNIWDMNWRCYVHNYVRGIKKGIFKEKEDATEVRRQQTLFWIEYVAFLTIVGAFYMYILKPVLLSTFAYVRV